MHAALLAYFIRCTVSESTLFVESLKSSGMLLSGVEGIGSLKVIGDLNLGESFQCLYKS